jgi:protein SCO1
MTSLAAALAVLLLGAQESRPPTAPADPAATVQPLAPPALPDEVLVDQDGKPVRLSELLKGRTVAISFVFTTCSTICSPMTAILARVQERLGDRLGRDVVLASITLDPRTDTPERLKAYADKFRRRDGWSFLTGPRDRMVRVQKAFGSYYPDKSSHTPTVIVGNESTGVWFRVNGFSSPKWLAEELVRIQQGGELPRPKTAAARK